MTGLKDLGVVRRMFCTHEYEFLDEAKYFSSGQTRPVKIVTFYRCKKCGKLQKIRM